MAVSVGGYSLPGMGDVVETAEREILWGLHGNNHAPAVWRSGVLNSGTVDAGSDVTTQLRPGLILADLGTGEFKQYDPASSTAAQRIPAAVLPFSVDMVDGVTGSAAAKYVPLLVGGPVVAGKLIGLDAWARSVMSKQFLFDDFLQGYRLPQRNEVAKTASYTVVAGDVGTFFTTTGASGAVVFTLPAIAAGLYFWFLNTVDQSMTVTSAAGTDIVTFDNAEATSLAFSTSSEKIGGFLFVQANQAGTKWYAQNLSFANTVTVA